MNLLVSLKVLDREAPPHFQFREQARAATMGSSNTNAPGEDLAGGVSVGIQDNDNKGEDGGGGGGEGSRQTVSGWRL